jgi:hypothetical protein
MGAEKFIAIERSETEEIRVEPREYQGRQYIDIRVYYLPEDNREMVPTRKGITIHQREIGKVQKALQRLLANE